MQSSTLTNHDVCFCLFDFLFLEQLPQALKNTHSLVVNQPQKHKQPAKRMQITLFLFYVNYFWADLETSFAVVKFCFKDFKAHVFARRHEIHVLQ